MFRVKILEVVKVCCFAVRRVERTDFCIYLLPIFCFALRCQAHLIVLPTLLVTFPGPTANSLMDQYNQQEYFLRTPKLVWLSVRTC